MATSGVSTYTVDTKAIVVEALELLGVLGEGEQDSINIDQYASAIRTLNMLIKNWQADGLNLFAVQKQYVFIKLGQQSYKIGPSTTDHVTSKFGETTTISQSDALTVVVTAEEGMLVGDYIGFAATGSTVEWTTIASIDSGLNEITVVDPVENLTVGGKVYFYTSKAGRPMHVLESYLRTGTNTDIPMGMISRIDYNELSVKNSRGIPNQAYYNPQRVTGTLYVWPTGSAETDYITLFVQRALDDQIQITDDLDYPQEWYLPLAYGLAKAMSPKFGIPKLDYERIVFQAGEYYETARGFDSEMYTSVFFKPDTQAQGSGGL